MKQDFLISRMEISETDALFEFRKKIFPENRKQMDRERWRWLYLTNPETVSLPVWLIKSRGRIVGTIGAVPTRIKIGKDCCLASFGADYFVDQEYLGFPSLRLLKAMLAESPLNVGANLSASAKRLFARMGYVDLSANLIQVGACISSGRTGIRSHLKAVSRKAIRKIACMGPWEIEITPKLPDGYQSLWEEIAPSLEVSVIKDASYLKWRYEQCPSADYRFILLKRDGKLRSLAVVGIDPGSNPNSENHGIILELIARNGDNFAARGAINACLEYFAGHGCCSCTSHLSKSWTSGSFALMGFSREPSNLGLMVLAAKENRDLHKARDARSWTFALGDTDRY